MTLLMNCVCPRHNTQGISFSDYSDIALSCQEDPYFDTFGGYDAFWSMLHHFFPHIFQELGGVYFITSSQLRSGYTKLDRMEEEADDAVRQIAKDYSVELTKAMPEEGVPNEAMGLTGEDIKTKQEEEQKKSRFHFNEQERAHWRREFKESPMGRELHEIISGKWSYIPHWSIKD